MPLPGLLAAAALATVAWTVGRLVPALGAAAPALLLGLAVRTALGPLPALRPGLDLTLKRLLRIAIVLFGATLSVAQIAAIGLQSVAIILGTVVLALVLTIALGRRLAAPPGLVHLIGAGTAICGATAIITLGPIIESRDEEIAFAISTIFLFNMLAVVVYPALGHLLDLSDRLFGVWAGVAIHDTSSVLAAAFAFSEPAGQVATVVKLARTLVLVPLAVAYGLLYAARPRAPAVAGGPPAAAAGIAAAGSAAGAFSRRRVDIVRVVPWFVVWFALAAALNSAGVLGPDLPGWASRIGRFLVVMVMAAVGLSADLARMRRLGLAPLYLGFAAAVAVAVGSLLLIRFLLT